MGRIRDVTMDYDKYDRSTGVAYVVFEHESDAREAVKEFDGQLAIGQRIRVAILPRGPAHTRRADDDLFPRHSQTSRNPVDEPEPRPRPLEERVTSRFADRVGTRLEDRIGTRLEDRLGTRLEDRIGTRRDDHSPGRHRDVSSRTPEGIDRYVPRNGRDSSRSARPAPTASRDGRRPGDNRRGSERGRRGGRGGRRTDEAGHAVSGARPRKTQEELDAEMADYWGEETEQAQPNPEASARASNANGGLANGNVTRAAPADDDIDMIE
jgi:THO complex subunit 4